MKINGNLIIEKENSKDYSDLTEVAGSVGVRQGATFTAPALIKAGSVGVQEGATFTAPLLAETLYKTGYKNLFDYHHSGKFPTGIYLSLLSEKEIEYLLKLKPIIETNRLYMNHWHQNENWKNQTIEQIHACGTTHCVAGWIQIFEKDKYNDMSAQEAGTKCAPNLVTIFNKTNEEVELIVKTLLG